MLLWIGRVSVGGMKGLTDFNGVSMNLTGRVALITGGSRGIGAATVRLFRQAGARVVFSYRQAEAEAQALVEACGGTSACVALRQELATAADGRALVQAAAQAMGRIDCLVVNHGVWPSHDAPITTMEESQWRNTLGINLDSVFGLIQESVRQMKEQTRPRESAGGHIVLVSSTAGQRGEAFHTDYAASKGALISMTKGLATELIRDGIYVNCVAPGWVRTEMSADALRAPDASNKILSIIPLGRVGDPEEIAGPILFLCTPWAGFMSGEIVNVNGGAVLVG